MGIILKEYKNIKMKLVFRVGLAGVLLT